MPKHSFLARLRRALPMLRELPPSEAKSIDVDANFGHYQVTIGPEYSVAECRQRHIPLHSRPIELHGQLDHLYVEKNRISPLPTQDLIDQHLKATVVINDVNVHIYDSDGDGATIRIRAKDRSAVEFRQAINMAGDDGEERLRQIKESGTLTRETYRIIQEDILRLLRQTRSATNGSQLS
jgi:hypothetical protein